MEYIIIKFVNRLQPFSIEASSKIEAEFIIMSWIQQQTRSGVVESLVRYNIKHKVSGVHLSSRSNRITIDDFKLFTPDEYAKTLVVKA